MSRIQKISIGLAILYGLMFLWVGVYRFFSIYQTINVQQYIGENQRENNQEFKAFLPTSSCLDYKELIDVYRNRTEKTKDVIYSQELVFNSFSLKIASKESANPNGTWIDCDQNTGKSKFKHIYKFSIPFVVMSPFDMITMLVNQVLVLWEPVLSNLYQVRKLMVIEMIILTCQFLVHSTLLFYYLYRFVPSLREDLKDYPICFNNTSFQNFCNGDLIGENLNFKNFKKISWDFKSIIYCESIITIVLFILIIRVNDIILKDIEIQPNPSEQIVN
ncbi:hypothetical protein DFA_03759 [Cavenderia fasciculata]|uniref:Transmembrane protein n=1 Tax=Cavenderia fasciculata TaxID=261658 RepID=F4Q0B6_CACFS|nr:uncharacterized protein DFA_03759 [Cavenderia fasciculata]EGG18267.1 hypothetical protein DFA_03759 [Cavenderia fasciculata]|eukprot:XP_004357090.1 hypothetical protein DFA_03759 [Cavenderia fasciculata]